MLTGYMLSDLQKYQIILTRDETYVGLLIVGVRSTGIYCRPGCPARTPKAENCEFFDEIAHAQAAGYRACKRCHPDTPFLPHSALVDKVLAALAADPLKVWRESDVTAAGWDNSTLRRQFNKHFGMSFLSYARQKRLSAAAENLKKGESVINAQIDAGYGSASGFRAAFQAQFGEAPLKAKENSAHPPLFVDWIETPLGRMIAIVDEAALYLLEFVDRKNMQGQLARLVKYYGRPIIAGATEVTQQIRRELEGYFAGKLTRFSTKMVLTGTDFQVKVWDALCDIPYGETRSYAELAKAVGSEKAVRAVAGSNARNALAIIIPCHRVIGKDGSLSGYAGGVERKLQLLKAEGALTGDLF